MVEIEMVKRGRNREGIRIIWNDIQYIPSYDGDTTASEEDDVPGYRAHIHCKAIGWVREEFLPELYNDWDSIDHPFGRVTYVSAPMIVQGYRNRRVWRGIVVLYYKHRDDEEMEDDEEIDEQATQSEYHASS